MDCEKPISRSKLMVGTSFEVRISSSDLSITALIGISYNEDLEAALEEEAVNDVCMDTATDGVGSFYKEEWDVIGGEPVYLSFGGEESDGGKFREIKRTT